MVRFHSTVAVIALPLLLAGCNSAPGSSSSAAAVASPTQDEDLDLGPLGDYDDLRSAFNDAAGSTRLIVILSPT